MPFPCSGLPVQMYSHKSGFSPTGFYCEAEKQIWQMLVLEEGPHRCEGSAEKEAFQQNNMLCLSSLSNKSLFHKVYRNGRTPLVLKIGCVGFGYKGSICLWLLWSVPLYLYHTGWRAAYPMSLVAMQLSVLSTQCDAVLVQTHLRAANSI